MVRSLIIASLYLAIIPISPGATLNWGNDIYSTLVDSKGAPLDQTYTFELGAFESGFVPGESNVTQWNAKWFVFDQADYNPILGYFTSTVQILAGGISNSPELTPNAPSFDGKSMYMWIHNNAGAQPGTEWMLVHAASWTFSSSTSQCCDNSQPIEWSVSDLTPGNSPVWGGQKGVPGSGEVTAPGNYTLQTFTVVPEATSMALAAVAVTFGVLRRRRETLE